MSENDNIKDFVRNQLGGALNIGVPRPRVPETPAPAAEKAPEKEQPAPAAEKKAEGKRNVGRPRNDVEKKKVSIYMTDEMKAKLVKIQHFTERKWINDVILEAIEEYIERHSM